MTLSLMETVVVVSLAAGIAVSFTKHETFYSSSNASLEERNECSFSLSMQMHAIDEQWVFNQAITESSALCYEDHE